MVLDYAYRGPAWYQMPKRNNLPPLRESHAHKRPLAACPTPVDAAVKMQV